MIVSKTLRSSTRSSAGILTDISRLRQKCDGDSHVLLFALSSNAPDLSQTVHQLGLLTAKSAGCLSAPEHPDVVSCSIALLDARKATLFRSDIPGHVPAQVGRWHSPKRMQEKTTGPTDDSMLLDFGVDWEEIWNKGVSTPPLPQELQKLQSVCPPGNEQKRTPDAFYSRKLTPLYISQIMHPRGSQTLSDNSHAQIKYVPCWLPVSAVHQEPDRDDVLLHSIHNGTSIYNVPQRQSVL
jgi:hypothetical protein